MVMAQRAHDKDKGVRRGLGRRHAPAADSGDRAMSQDHRLMWLSIALVASIDGGVLAGLLTAAAGGTKQVALGAGGVAALGTFGAILTAVRFLNHPSEQ
jgi:hypothetical protein